MYVCMSIKFYTIPINILISICNVLQSVRAISSSVLNPNRDHFKLFNLNIVVAITTDDKAQKTNRILLLKFTSLNHYPFNLLKNTLELVKIQSTGKNSRTQTQRLNNALHK